MKKLVSLITVMVMILSISTLSLADTNEQYHFELDYEGNVIENEAKNAEVLLVGENGQLYTNVRIRILGTGPAEPKVIAYDENGKEYDMAENEYWGPASGFPIQGTFENRTPVTIIYPKAGTYTTTLQLLDVANNNDIITSSEFTINVLSANTGSEDDKETGNIVPNENLVTENTVEKLPQAGINLLEYAIYLGIISIVFFIILKKRNNSSN